MVEEEILPLTSRSLAGVCPFEESISVWFETDTVGNAKATELDIVESWEVEKKNLFAIFPIGATIQDSSKRKRSDDSSLFQTLVLQKLYNIRLKLT